MGVLLLLLTWGGDLLGITVCYALGAFTQKGLNTTQIIATWHEIIPGLIPAPSPSSPSLSPLGLILAGSYLVLSLSYSVNRLVQHHLERQKLDRLSKQQQAQLDQISTQITAKDLRYPRHIYYRPGPRFHRLYWIGWSLVIDGGLLTTTRENQFLPPLFLHALGQYNSSDIWLRWLLSTVPPLGAGSLLMSIAWNWYWRQRILVADRFVVWLDGGYADALMHTLDTVLRPLEHSTIRWLRQEPYIEQRIEAIRLLQHQGSEATHQQ